MTTALSGAAWKSIRAWLHRSTNLGFSPKQLKSGIPELDNLLGGGLDSGTSTLLLGPAGCGKSTIAVRYAVSAAEQGGCAAVFRLR